MNQQSQTHIMLDDINHESARTLLHTKAFLIYSWKKSFARLQLILGRMSSGLSSSKAQASKQTSKQAKETRHLFPYLCVACHAQSHVMLYHQSLLLLPCNGLEFLRGTRRLPLPRYPFFSTHTHTLVGEPASLLLLLQMTTVLLAAGFRTMQSSNCFLVAPMRNAQCCCSATETRYHHVA